MEITKQLGTYVEEATNDCHTEVPLHLYQKILGIINSRVDMYLSLNLGLNIHLMLSPKGSPSKTKKSSLPATIS